MREDKILCVWMVVMTVVVALLTVTAWRPLLAHDDVGRDVPVPTVGAAGAAASVIPPLGAPGTSFRYVQTYGTAGQPYFEDAAHLNYPTGVAVEGGALWITEDRGQRALKLSAPGVLVNQIGSAGQRYASGTSFQSISDIAIGPDGTVWLVDRDVAYVVQFNQNGEILKTLGQSWSGGDGNDQFNWPNGIAVDAAGNVYVGDTSNHRIQIFDNTGAYRATLGVTGVCAQDNAHFCWPYRLNFGPGNLLYIADHGNQRVQIYNVAAPYAPVYVATIGETGQGGDSNTRFDGPAGVAADSRYIYVADEDNHRVQVFNQATRAYVATLGSGWGSGPTSLRHPLDVAVDAASNIYITDYVNARVQQYNGALAYVRTFGVTGVPYLTDNKHYNTPSGLAVTQDNNVLLLEEEGKRLIALNSAGDFQWSVGVAGAIEDVQQGNDKLSWPADVAAAPNNTIYVADAGNKRVQVFNASGGYVATMGSGEGTANNQFSWPSGVFVAPNGTVYVADSSNHRVQIFNSAHAYIATLGVTGQAGADNQHFDWPTDVAVDSRGVIYVVDHGNHRIQVFDAGYNYVRTLGVTGVTGDDFGHFGGASKLAIDSSDRVYVTSQWNHYVLVFDKDGGFLTRLGGYGSSSARLLDPHGVAINPAGELLVADYNNHRVQKFALGTPNWRQVNINGFGNPQQNAGALASFGGKLASGTYNFDGGANLWQLNGSWTQAATGGLGDPTNVGIVRLFEFGGQLYAGGDNWDEAANRSTGAQLLRSANGTAWTPVMTGGFGRIDNGGIFAIDAFSGTLYAGTYSYTSTHGAELWRSATGNPGDWQQVVPNGFGTTSNRGIWSLAPYHGHFYAGTRNTQSGPEIWRSPDGLNWNKIATNGFGASSLTMVFALEPFNGYLYAGVHSNPSVNTTDAILWRCQTCDGSDWQAVTPLRFGSSDNRAVESLIVYNRMLFAFTGNQSTGMEVWRTSDGASWAQIGFAGLGDANNTWPLYDNSTVIHNGNLYVGVWNTAGGGRIWQYIPDRAAVDITDPAQPATLIFTPTTGGKSTVQIPANTLDQATELVYEPFTPSTQPAGFAFAGRAFELNAYRADALVENLNFLQPVTVILDYTDAEVAGQDESKLELRRWDVATSTWVDAACGAYDRQPAQNRLSVPVCHLSQFGLFGPMEYIYLPAVRR